MIDGMNNRFVGAVFVGIALVLSAFLGSRIGKLPEMPPEPVYVAAVSAPTRTPITVTDSNNDGIEDWQEPFLTAEPVILNTTTASYTPPTTLTGQLGVAMMEQMLMSKSINPNSTVSEDFLNQSVQQVVDTVQDTLYTQASLQIIPENSPELFRTYGNTAATILANNDIKGIESELSLLNKAISMNDPRIFAQITQIAQAYAKNRDDLLALPVPSDLADEHLTLINVFHMMQSTINAFTVINEDPLRALLRLRRYQDDASALVLALRGVHAGLSVYPNLFSINDPGLAFSDFQEKPQP